MIYFTDFILVNDFKATHANYHQDKITALVKL